jgi:hypothetical protein
MKMFLGIKESEVGNPDNNMSSSVLECVPSVRHTSNGKPPFAPRRFELASTNLRLSSLEAAASYGKR